MTEMGALLPGGFVPGEWQVAARGGAFTPPALKVVSWVASCH